jgi:hypothetical protein
VAESKETAKFIINKSNIEIFVLMLKIFGTLSEKHNKEIVTNINKIIG